MHALGGRGAVDGNIKTFSSFSRKKEMIVKKLSLGQNERMASPLAYHLFRVRRVSCSEGSGNQILGGGQNNLFLLQSSK